MPFLGPKDIAFSRKKPLNCRWRHSRAIFCTKASPGFEWEDKNKLRVLNDPLNIENWWNEIKQQISIREAGKNEPNGALPSRKVSVGSKKKNWKSFRDLPEKKGTESRVNIWDSRLEPRGEVELNLWGFVEHKNGCPCVVATFISMIAWNITKLCTKLLCRRAFDVEGRGLCVRLLAKAADLAHSHVASLGTLYSPEFHK